MSITPSVAVDIIKESSISFSIGKTLYVGGSGLGNYTIIQDAIENASDGDTVFVYDDSSPYYEQLLINKTIYLIGENKYTTVIDAQHEGTPVEISNADNCLVSGFTIQNCMEAGNTYSQSVVCIYHSDYVIIKDNYLTMGGVDFNSWMAAVELDNCTYCTVQDNFIFEDDYEGSTAGVSLREGSSHNTISGNDISNYTVGVETSRLINNYNIISGNHIHHNRCGIEIDDDIYNEILNNIIEYNEGDGIRNEEAHYTTISGNIISYNGECCLLDCGIYLTRDTHNNYISDNVISNNNPAGIIICDGVDNVVTRNNFIENWGDSGTPERWWGNAYFLYELKQFRFHRLNCWRRNYWSGHFGIFPKAIHGEYLLVPWIEFDWFPRIIPFKIDTAQGCDIL